MENNQPSSTADHAEHRAETLQSAIDSLNTTPGISAVSREQLRQSLQAKLNKLNKDK